MNNNVNDNNCNNNCSNNCNKKMNSHKVKMSLLIVFNALVLVALIVVSSFTWIPNTIRKAEMVKYENDLVVSSLEIDLILYVYDQSTYDTESQSYGKYIQIASFNHLNQNSSDFSQVNMRLNPGDKMSYRMQITNVSKTSSLIADMSLEDFYAKYDESVHGAPDHPDDDIFDYLSINIVSPEVSEIPKLSEDFTTSYTDKKNLMFYKDLTILPNETVYINWYIELSTEADNQFWGTEIGFKHIFFGI